MWVVIVLRYPAGISFVLLDKTTTTTTTTTTSTRVRPFSKLFRHNPVLIDLSELSTRISIILDIV